MNKKKRIRTEFRKKHESRRRQNDVTRDYSADAPELADAAQSERVSGKGELTRHRTVIGEIAQGEAGVNVRLDVDDAVCRRGRVLSVHGLASRVRDDATGEIVPCATRRLLKSLSTDQRHVVAVGDRVVYRREPRGEGMIERIEARHGLLCRTSKGRQQILVANLDQILIVSSAAEPTLKPNLIDRFLIAAEQHHLRPTIVINKIDLIDAAEIQPLVGVYGQMGYSVLLVSAETGHGVDRLRRTLVDKESAVCGQSGVGKSSLLNAVQPGLDLLVRSVSTENQKGRHTTTTATLIPLAAGGFVVDTPGIRQFQLWDVAPQEVAGYFRDLRPYVSHCRFPDCTHTHESDCAVKDAVADGRLDLRRYESYCHIRAGDDA